MKPSHDATLLAHRQLADLQQHHQQAGLAALVHPKSPARNLLNERSNDSSPVRDPPPSPPLLKYRRVHSQQASAGATKRSHGASRLAPRSYFLDEDEIDAFDCAYLGASQSLEDAAEYQARCVDHSGVSLQRVKRDKGKRKAEDQDAVHDLDRRAAPRTRPLVFAGASATTTSRSFLHTPRVLPNAAVSTTTSLNPAQSSASRSRALASSSSSSSSAAAASSRASVSSSSAASASRSAASRIASRASILNAATPGLLTSVQGAFTDAASVVSSRSASIASASAASRTPSSSVASTSASSATSASSPVSTSSGMPSASATPSSSGNNHRIRDIVVPSVVIPVVLLLLALFCFFCQRRRREPKSGRTPSSFGAISHPMRSPFGSPYATYGAAGAGAGLGAAGLAGARGNPSAESFATTPSAIGVAFSEPRTKWGRRSLNDVVAAGAVGAGSAAAAGKGRGQVISASSSFGGGRQPSITNMSEISDASGSRAYSPNAYRPGMPRPLVAPPGQHYDPFQAPPSIVPVAARGSSTAWAAASSGSGSAYGSEGDAESLLGSDDRGPPPGLAPPIASTSASPYSSPQAQEAQHSRVDTQTSGEDVFYTDVASSMDDEEELTAQQAPVDFGSSGSSGSEGIVGAAAAARGSPPSGGEGTPRQRAPSTTPSHSSTPSSRNGTPRLGAGHGSMGGVRKGDGSWW